MYIIGFKPLYNNSGDDSNEDPPVPIPNTEVKLIYARSTCLLRPGDKVVAGFQKITQSVLRAALFLTDNLAKFQRKYIIILTVWGVGGTINKTE